MRRVIGTNGSKLTSLPAMRKGVEGKRRTDEGMTDLLATRVDSIETTLEMRTSLASPRPLTEPDFM
jgi:hypothetical protein